ncbi:hypothetical protein BKA70DRAFT_1236906 [Coprinopsis sp. MPI-PUGE-AT-0042]|nr:hypothetical protein BKA70DRAFT_1236906 [Coprinopsis sp. MPI-PUGE-AT-0042]
MPPLFAFSDEEQSCLQSYSLRWVDAVTIIAKQMVADEASGELATKRQEHLATPLSPRERQDLYEAVRTWFRKKHRVTHKVPGSESIGRVTARTIFCRTKPRTIREIQKRLFERDQTFPFPYSLEKVVDKELVNVTEEEMLSLDEGKAGEYEEIAMDEVDIEGYDGEEEELDIPKRSVAEAEQDDRYSELGARQDSGSLSESATAPTAKEIANLAFRYYQQAVTIGLRELPEAEMKQYVLKARVARAKGLSDEDKKRNIETSLTHAMRKGAEHLWNHFGVKVVYAITFEDKEGTLRAVVQDFNEELGGGASFVKQNNDFLHESGFYTALAQFAKRDWPLGTKPVAERGQRVRQGAHPLLKLPSNEFGEPILPNPGRIPQVKEVEWLVAVFRSFITVHYAGRDERSSPPWSDMAARPSHYFPPEILAPEYAQLIKEPSKMGKANLLKILKHLFHRQEAAMKPRFQMTDNRPAEEATLAPQAPRVQRKARKQTQTKRKAGKNQPPLPSPQTTPGLSRSPTPAQRELSAPLDIVVPALLNPTFSAAGALALDVTKTDLGLDMIPESGSLSVTEHGLDPDTAIGTSHNLGGLPAALKSDEDLLLFNTDQPMQEIEEQRYGTTKEIVELAPGVWASSPVRKPLVSASHRIQMQFKPQQSGRTLQGLGAALKESKHVEKKATPGATEHKGKKQSKGMTVKGGSQMSSASSGYHGDGKLQIIAGGITGSPGESAEGASDDGWVEDEDAVPKEAAKKSPRKRKAAPVLVGLAKDRVRREPKVVKRMS